MHSHHESFQICIHINIIHPATLLMHFLPPLPAFTINIVADCMVLNISIIDHSKTLTSFHLRTQQGKLPCTYAPPPKTQEWRRVL